MTTIDLSAAMIAVALSIPAVVSPAFARAGIVDCMRGAAEPGKG